MFAYFEFMFANVLTLPVSVVSGDLHVLGSVAQVLKKPRAAGTMYARGPQFTTAGRPTTHHGLKSTVDSRQSDYQR